MQQQQDSSGWDLYRSRTNPDHGSRLIASLGSDSFSSKGGQLWVRQEGLRMCRASPLDLEGSWITGISWLVVSAGRLGRPQGTRDSRALKIQRKRLLASEWAKASTGSCCPQVTHGFGFLLVFSQVPRRMNKGGLSQWPWTHQHHYSPITTFS